MPESGPSLLAGQRIAFVTGRLAEPALRHLLDDLAAKHKFEPFVCCMKISVAALMSVRWLLGKLKLPAGCHRVVLPGLCQGDTQPLTELLQVPVERGPNDLHDLPAYLTGQKPPLADYGQHSIEILAEINHANRLTPAELLAQAQHYIDSGADIIDLGCTPSESWADGIGEAVKLLRDQGMRVSIDSFESAEVAAGCRAGAELVLSVDSSNVAAASDWGVPVVVVPDQPVPLREQPESQWLESLQRTAHQLDAAKVPYRLDPILEPLGFGLAASLVRYARVREQFPNAAALMGIGNLSELTAVDSAGVNTLLIGLCQELGITSVLTTEVVYWAASAVRETAIARQLMHYAVEHGRIPKHIDDRLVTLRAGKPVVRGDAELRRLQQAIKDQNFRIFAERGLLFALNGDRFVAGTDAFAVFDELAVDDPSHAFYLGWEMCKASLALQLGKRYDQDQALQWGFLTQEEISHRARKAATADQPTDTIEDKPVKPDLASGEKPDSEKGTEPAS